MNKNQQMIVTNNKTRSDTNFKQPQQIEDRLT